MTTGRLVPYTCNSEQRACCVLAVQLEGAVIDIPRETQGEAVHAIVVYHRGRQRRGEEFVAHCRQHIAGYKVPLRVGHSSHQESGDGLSDWHPSQRFRHF